MAYVNYVEVGKEVAVASIAGTVMGAAHFMFFAPQFAGQQIMGIKTSTIVDVIVAFVVGVATKMYARTKLGEIMGYGAAAVLGAIGILDQLGWLAAPAAARATVTAPTRVGVAGVPRASYLAPSGVVVNKHGTVPEIAPGTFG